VKLRLYNVLDQYIDYLRQFDKKVLLTKDEDRIKDRKYLGTVLTTINNFNYFVPLSSPKETDYEILSTGEKIIRKSIIPIMRIISKDNFGEKELKGTLKFSNMIPIPDIALVDYDVQKENDETYKILILKELDFIKDHEDIIINNARVIYNQKINNYKNIKYLNSTVNFKLLEEKCKEYENTLQKQIATATVTNKQH